MKHKRIDLNIEEIILDGFATGDGERIKVSVEQELTRLLAEQGVSQRLVENVNIARLEGGQIGIEPNANRGSAGKQIARAIYGAIKR